MSSFLLRTSILPILYSHPLKNTPPKAAGVYPFFLVPSVHAVLAPNLWAVPTQPYSRHEKWCWRLRATRAAPCVHFALLVRSASPARLPFEAKLLRRICQSLDCLRGRPLRAPPLFAAVRSALGSVLPTVARGASAALRHIPAPPAIPLSA